MLCGCLAHARAVVHMSAYNLTRTLAQAEHRQRIRSRQAATANSHYTQYTASTMEHEIAGTEWNEREKRFSGGVLPKDGLNHHDQTSSILGLNPLCEPQRPMCVFERTTQKMKRLKREALQIKARPRGGGYDAWERVMVR